MNGELLIRNSKQNKESLNFFVSELPRLLGCCPWEERESSNYIEERYYCCFVLGLRATASIADDDSDFPGYQFRLYLNPEFLRSDTAFLAELADCVARKLVVNGYEVLRPFDSLRPGNGGLLYQFDPTAGTIPWEQVITQMV
jgi:hypothetical protein